MTPQQARRLSGQSIPLSDLRYHVTMGLLLHAVKRQPLPKELLEAMQRPNAKGEPDVTTWRLLSMIADYHGMTGVLFGPWGQHNTLPVEMM